MRMQTRQQFCWPGFANIYSRELYLLLADWSNPKVECGSTYFMGWENMCVSLRVDRDLTNLQENSQVVTAVTVRPDESFILARFLGDIAEELSCRRSRALVQVVQKECFVGNKSLNHVLIFNFEQGSVIFSSPSLAKYMSHPCMQDRWCRALTFPALCTLKPWVGLHVGIGWQSRQMGHTYKFTHINVH